MTDSAPARLRAPPDGLCLAFANTLYWRGTVPPTETLHGPEDLLAWAAAEQVLEAAPLAALRAAWQANPQEAAAAFARAIALRESLFRIFAATASGTAPAEAELAGFNAALEAAPERSRLRPGAGGYVWEVAGLRDGLALLLAPVLWSAGDLLAGPRLQRVRQCANPRCGWLFLDESKGGNRRWCSMASCGNRAKAHRHYARQKQERQG